MNVLDENIPDNQRQLLRSWRIHVRQIGHEVGRQGMKVIRMSHMGIQMWKLHAEREEKPGWPP